MILKENTNPSQNPLLIKHSVGRDVQTHTANLFRGTIFLSMITAYYKEQCYDNDYNRTYHTATPSAVCFSDV